ncbi:ZIP family metal transporter [Pedobacter sp. MC2016-05]|jgi:zinc transporter ZupT|uniref:ZIP family metal transporter n=1 Tax=unclassified Pedobacter TaxID=2628915 RepID=UPI0007034538|nr:MULTISPECIES: ZIP family metal transporter [unclassified Pedobacter]KQN33347.1 zinc/iron permease [Pedobacter sp. Leaf41]MCX2475575.1 ZIP family metal transporter [Pedobacter sp. MC2016-05]
MEAWKFAVLFFCAFLGGSAIFLVKSDKSKLLKLILSFSGSYLFAITVLHLIPDAYSGPDKGEIGIFILVGFLLQVFLEQFSEGVEHGHIHKHHDGNVFPFGIMISLCLHAFLEGMPLAKDQHNELIFGISLHHIPAAFALASILMQNHFKKGSIIMYLIIFAVMAPLGFYVSVGLSNGTIGGIDAYFNKIMGIVIGIFLHISTTILFESSADHKINTRKMIAVLLGIGVALIGFFAGHSH